MRLPMISSSSGVLRKRRHAALAEMVAHADRTGSLDAPWEQLPSIWEHFRDEADILRELHQDWRTSFAGAVYVAIEQGDGDLQHDVLTAYRSLQHRYAGARRLLEHHADHPAIAAVMRKERALLSSFSILTDGSGIDRPGAEGADTQAA